MSLGAVKLDGVEAELPSYILSSVKLPFRLRTSKDTSKSAREAVCSYGRLSANLSEKRVRVHGHGGVVGVVRALALCAWLRQRFALGYRKRQFLFYLRHSFKNRFVRRFGIVSRSI